MRTVQLTEVTSQGVNKATRYGWGTIEDGPGELRYIPKQRLQVDKEYQRDLITAKVKEITASWSWIACGVLVVAQRGGGALFLVDGQHRWAASMRRSDVSELPCVVFGCNEKASEAAGFVAVNTSRKPIAFRQRHKAMVIAGDKLATAIEDFFASQGMTYQRDKEAGNIQCLYTCYRYAADNFLRFTSVLELAHELAVSDQVVVSQVLFDALWILDGRLSLPLATNRVAVARIRQKGAVILCTAAKRASALYGKGGGNVWARGFFEELNKGLRNKLQLKKEFEV